MRKITIVGAGQFGLHLGIGLLREGYEVTIVTNRTADEVASGKVLSSQILFGPVLKMEADLGLNPWIDDGGHVDGVSFTVGDGAGGRMLGWSHDMGGLGGQSVDQRIKMPRWMSIFEERGGTLVIKDAGVDDLEVLATECDLLIVASGKGEISSLFARDDRRSEIDRSQRHLAMVYVLGMEPDQHGAHTSRYVQIPGVGEYVTFPCLSLNGPCDIIMYESVVGGPMHEMLKDVRDADAMLTAGVAVLDRIAPWEADRCRGLTVSDPLSFLTGAVTPTVRRPLAALPSGRTVMGGGDVCILNDPLTGQGANNASKHADVVLRAIVAHGDRPFDAAFMERTFDAHWEKAQWVCRFANLMLNPTPDLAALMMAASAKPQLRRDFFAGFADASTFADWLFDGEGARRKIAAAA
ncbi:MAG: styrene monooxygenase/indole monooxygenase family protein [Pseudomonadota bacterium]